MHEEMLTTLRTHNSMILTTLHTNNSIMEQILVELQDALDHRRNRVSLQSVARIEELAKTTTSDTAILSKSDNVIMGSTNDDLDSQITYVARSFIHTISTRGSIVGQTNHSVSRYNQSSSEDEEVRSEVDQGTEGQPSTDSGGVRLPGFGVDTASRYLQNIPPVPLVDRLGNHSLNKQAATHTSSTIPQHFPIEHMNDLLDRYVSKAHEDLSARNFQGARDNLVRAVNQGKERETVYNCPFEAELDITISLAKAYVGLGQFDSAERALQPLLSIARPPKDGELCYTRAVIHLENYRKTQDSTILDRLIKLARDSYSIAVQSDSISKPFLTESAKILAESYEWSGDLVGAEAIRGWHSSIVSTPVCTGVPEPALEPQLRMSGSISTEIDSSVGVPLSSDQSLGLMPIRCSTEQRSQAGSSSTPPTSAGPISHDLDATSILLFQASQHGDVSRTKKYLNMGANIEHIDGESGYTPLLVAAKHKHSGVCQLLVNGFDREDGSSITADIRAKDHTGRNVLHHALFGSGPEVMILFLIEKGADLNARDTDKKTPLHYCVKFNKCQAAKNLLHNGADKEARCKAGETPLSLAFRLKRWGLATILVHAGAVIEEPALNDSNPDIQYIVREYRQNLEEKSKQAKISRQASNTTAASHQTTETAASKSSSFRSNFLVRLRS